MAKLIIKLQCPKCKARSEKPSVEMKPRDGRPQCNKCQVDLTRVGTESRQV